ncbi:MAG: Holliday junction branch migration protein RuvA [Lachnospiraceae bacterium]|nr:Holliday junction branch migration protein RuvA [Lachnospiraceae bacterium]
MIGYVKGELAESRIGRVVVEVNGFGIIVGVSESVRDSLPSIGEEVKLYTHTAVREDDISLYGFLSRDDLDFFESLITVSGVGPKVALGLLGAYPASEVKYLILTGDSGKLSKAPGIGRKTAERIILELKDKISKDDILTLDSVSAPAGNDLPESARDAVMALVTLGYSKAEAERAVSQSGPFDGKDVNAILKTALQHLF